MAKYLDLDALAKEQEFILTLHGKKHTLKPITVADFAETMKMISELAVDASIEKEIEMMSSIILRSFPTMTEADVGSLSLAQLRVISEYAQMANSEVVSVTTEDAEGNAKPAN